MFIYHTSLYTHGGSCRLDTTLRIYEFSVGMGRKTELRNLKKMFSYILNYVYVCVCMQIHAYICTYMCAYKYV